MQDDIGTALVDTLKGTAFDAVLSDKAYYGLTWVHGADLGKTARALVRPMGFAPVSAETTHQTSGQFDYEYELVFELFDRDTLAASKTAIQNALRTTLGDDGEDLYALLTDSTGTLLGGSLKVALGFLTDEAAGVSFDNTEDADFLRLRAPVTVRVWQTT